MAFINGIGLISPQRTVESTDFLSEVVEYTADYLKCIEPAYRSYIDPIQSRRMSRLIKMGISAAKMSVAEANLSMPDAIITGTGLGSVEDTEKILGDLTREERFLNPTPFIQSTYNTISSQVAIQLKCNNYNSTYVHRTFSFESGMIDGLLQIEEQTASNILIGGIDEMTMNHLLITRRIGQWKMQPISNLKLREYQTPGAMAGEGAAFFVLGSERISSTYAEVKDVKTWIRMGNEPDTGTILGHFLETNNLTAGDIDLVLLGTNGDVNYDLVSEQFADQFFKGKPLAWYKHLCGEYHTATGFGLYVAANLLKRQIYSEILHWNQVLPTRLKNILIYNHFRNVDHSFILVRGI